MYNKSRQYELSFVAPKNERQMKRRIVFSIKEKHLEETLKRLTTLAINWRRHADVYCLPGTDFTYPAQDFFGRIEFGYGKCGFVTRDDDNVNFNVELNGGKLSNSTLTIKLLSMALAVPIENSPPSNQLQQLDLEIRCDHDPVGYGHAMGGYVSARLIKWLKKKASPDKSVRVPEEVVQAMREAWKAVCPKGQKRWAEACNGLIASDGRFMLECFGNACDVAIYPDHTCGEMSDEYVYFSCHNLDSSLQQMTLLAGIAKMCELARQDE